MAGSESVLPLFIVFLLLLSEHGLGQTVVDSDRCKSVGKKCPGESDPTYKTKCCVETDGGAQLLVCCNPLVGLYIGLGVSLPIIVGTIVCFITLCCCWMYRSRKKSRAIQRLRQRTNPSPDAPPPYTPTAEGEEDNQLPLYTKEDPYSNITAPSPANRSTTQDETELSPGPNDSQPLLSEDNS